MPGILSGMSCTITPGKQRVCALLILTSDDRVTNNESLGERKHLLMGAVGSDSSSTGYQTVYRLSMTGVK